MLIEDEVLRTNKHTKKGDATPQILFLENMTCTQKYSEKWTISLRSRERKELAYNLDKILRSGILNGFGPKKKKDFLDEIHTPLLDKGKKNNLMQNLLFWLK